MKYNAIKIDFYRSLNGLMLYLSTEEFSGTKTQIKKQARIYSNYLRDEYPHCRIIRSCDHRDFQDLAPQLRFMV